MARVREFRVQLRKIFHSTHNVTYEVYAVFLALMNRLCLARHMAGVFVVLVAILRQHWMIYDINNSRAGVIHYTSV